MAKEPRSLRSVLAASFAVLLPCLFGALAGLGVYTFHYAKGASYLSNNPQSCVNCHIMREQYDGWQHASHHAVATCNDCHVPHGALAKWPAKASNGFWHSLYFTLQNHPEPIRIRPGNAAILRDNCVRCHEELLSEVLHAHGQAEGLDCVRCHQGVGHGPPR
jgi:cytochrome c nitrite reductase small subunit